MPIDGVIGVGDLNYVGTPQKNENTSGLSADMNTFLQLLVAQMQYQDPLEPKKDSDFVAQLAQLTSLEQLQQVNQSLATSQAYGLVGKNVYAEVLNSLSGVTEAFVGRVESIAIRNGTAYAIVGDNAIPIDNILIVTDTPFQLGDIPTLDGEEEAPNNEKDNDTTPNDSNLEFPEPRPLDEIIV